MLKSFDVFISYRRIGGFETANLLYERLTQSGYRVFMDIENIRSGKFNTQLYEQIDSCKDFIVVLGPDSLDRCVDVDDWVRLEVARAIQKDKNIIPIFLRGFVPPKNPLPIDISELLNYEGIEASPQLFNAFLEKLKGMLSSKRHFNWQRTRRPFLTIIFPLLLLIGLLVYLHLYNVKKERVQVEQVCTQVISEISAGFVQGNTLIGVINDANKKWKEFHMAYQVADNEKERLGLKIELNQYLDFQLAQVEETKELPAMSVTAAHEELLSKNGISVQDINAARSMFLSDIEGTKNFLIRIQYWLVTPDIAWPDQLDESIDLLASINVEMINEGIYDFNELMIEMPEKSQKAYFKFQPLYTNFTAKVNFNASKEQLEADQEQSFRRCEDFVGEYSTIVGNDNISLEILKNQLDYLKRNNEVVNPHPNIDSLKQVVEKKKEDLALIQSEVDSKTKMVRESYQRILQKNSFDKTEKPGIMWGKILILARFALDQIQFEKDCEAENERLRKESVEKGIDPDFLEPVKTVISSNEVFQEIQKRLDLYLEFNKTTDQNASIYVPAAKKYYQLVSEGKLEPLGVLIVGTSDNLPHPLIKTGDIVIKKKGEQVIDVDSYFALNKKEVTNTQSLIRFVDGKMTSVTGTVPSDCNVLVGALDLWGEK